MKPTLEHLRSFSLYEFDKRVEQGLIRKVEKGNLVLYNYTDQCVYEKAWDRYTIAARGIIFEKTTGRVIARPFEKFFNLNEMPHTEYKNLPLLDYHTSTEKMDGSLGIVYYYGNKWNVATRGSFDSEQAVRAEGILGKYDVSELFEGLTYLVEIIYPENKIVVNYGNTEDLYFITAMTLDGIEVHDNPIFPEVNEVDLDIEEMIAQQKLLPKDKEGFVVRFENGLRVKIKGEEYLRIHKMISCMSPLSFWESMKNGEVTREYVQQLPEEFRSEFEPMIDVLEMQYEVVLREVIEDYQLLPCPVSFDDHRDYLKAVGLMTQDKNSGLKHPGAVFPYILSKRDALDKYIMKFIRPDGNILKIVGEQSE